MSPAAGQFVTETFSYDGGRQVTAYVPSDPAEAVVFAGDGGWHISRLGRALGAAAARSTMVVGVHGLPDDDGRLTEYVPGFDGSRFAAHERFFVDDVRRWVRKRFGVALPAERTAVWGASDRVSAIGSLAGADSPLNLARHGLPPGVSVACVPASYEGVGSTLWLHTSVTPVECWP